MQNSAIHALPEVVWPAVTGFRAAQLLALLFQFEQTQFLSAKQLLERQFAQLGQVLDHARTTVPLYRERLNSLSQPSLSLCCEAGWASIPVLTRRDIQLAGDQLHSQAVPGKHGKIHSSITSGSTSQPVATLRTELSRLFWQALTLRDHHWHARRYGASLASIRHLSDAGTALPPDGIQSQNWGSATEGVYATGPAYLLNVRSSIQDQVAWLCRVTPGYLLSYPSILVAIGEALHDAHIRLPNLLEVRSYGEVLEPAVRERCEALFGVKVVDMYSSQEVGYIALECPVSGKYHIQSENLLVEVLDEKGHACQPGEIGRVVVTTLHEFAMPLLRYEIGDYAEVGELCPCGRGLPVLNRVLGRQRNLLIMPDGSRRWPVFDAGGELDQLPPFFQFQVIQKSRDDVEVLVVRHQSLTEEELVHMERHMVQTLGAPFRVCIKEVDSIPRSPSGKFEDFICEVV
jgi:phenylacetate-CoA ligase